MGKNLAFLAVTLCAGLAFSQENYAQWGHYKTVTINTANGGGGANVPGTVTNFPLLVRLTSANADVFSQALSGGADIRFTDSTGAVRLKHQSERWDSAGQVAEFWVLAPSVAGNSNTTLRIYWGKSGAADSSQAASVFSPTNGFLAVWHFNEASGSTLADASGGGHVATPGTTAPTNVTTGIGIGKSFSGNANSSYSVATGTTSLSLNTDNGPYTISAWVNPTSCAQNTNRYTILSKYNTTATGGKQYFFGGSLAANEWKFLNAPTALSGVTTNNEYGAVTTCTVGAWQYLVAKYSLTGAPAADGASAANATIMVNRTAAVTGITGGSATSGTTAAVFIGKTEDNLRPMNGGIDELIVSNVARSADWLSLSHATQVPGATAVALGSTQNAAPPGAPTGVTGTAGNGQVVVAWTAPSSPGSSAITGYTVTSNPENKSCTTTGSLTCTMTGLTNGTAYTFTATATNAAGTSVASAASASVTPIAATGVPGPPTGVTAIAGNAQVTVSWTAPSSTGSSAITGYTATSNPDGKTCTTTGALTCLVTGLTNGTSYTFTVTAANASGSSVASAASGHGDPFTIPGSPTNVTGVGGNAQVVVSWTAPASTGGSAITGYTATSSPEGKTCTSSSASCTITALTNGTAYTFTVIATNTAGSSAASAPSSAVTPASVPGAPTGVSASPLNLACVGCGYSGDMVVSWAAPTSTGGSPITGYRVTLVQDTSKHCMTTGALTCNVIYPPYNSPASFTVTASNAIGTGPASTASTPVNTGPSSILTFSKSGFSIQQVGSNVSFRLPDFTGSVRILLLDLQGRPVWVKTVRSGVREVSLSRNTSGLVPGLYILRIVLQDGEGGAARLAAESKVLLTP